MLTEPGPRNLITDVDGITVGNAATPDNNTGVTVVLPAPRATAGVDIRGGAPGTRETDLLSPTCHVDAVDAIVLSGGSVYGLAAGDGVVAALTEQGRGHPVGVNRMPIVPGAILFDLPVGESPAWKNSPPYRDLGIRAASAASETFGLGNSGAGAGARAGCMKGGLGSVSLTAEDGLTVGALIAANPVGSVLMPGTDIFWAWPFERHNEFGGRQPAMPYRQDHEDLPLESRVAGNTTIGVVATNAALSMAEASRVAIMAHDGLARAIRPVHTPYDGDSLFVLATDRWHTTLTSDAKLLRIGSMAADCVARAVARGVYEANKTVDE